MFAAAPATLAGYVLGGRLSDRFGRRPVTAVGVLAFALGAVLMFSGSKALYVPAFFILTASDACIQSVRIAYASELFATEVRATLCSFIGAINVAAGSLGLVLAGALASVITPTTTAIVIAVGSAAAVVALRLLPETSGGDVIGVPAHLS